MQSLQITNRKSSSKARKGMTLIELLVVSAIMVILMSVSIPVLTPMAENRMTREAARGVQAALESARARAIRLKRPCAVALTPLHENYNFSCIQLEQMTSPHPFIGTYVIHTDSNYASIVPPNNIKLYRGDSVQLNYTGPVFVIQKDDNPAGQSDQQQDEQSHYMISFKTDDNDNSSYTTLGCTYDYKKWGDDKQSGECIIYKNPVYEKDNAFAKALGLETGYTLPKGCIVDLHYCKSGSKLFKECTNPKKNRDGDIINKQRPPIILFREDGSASLYIDGYAVRSDSTEYLQDDESGKIYLLVGEWGRMMDGTLCLADDGKNNSQVYSNYWVVVSTKTGEVHCVRNGNNLTGTVQTVGGN